MSHRHKGVISRTRTHTHRYNGTEFGNDYKNTTWRVNQNNYCTQPVCCSVLQCVAVCCSVLPRIWHIYELSQSIRITTVLNWYVVECCSMLQSAVVCCSVLKCVATMFVCVYTYMYIYIYMQCVVMCCSGCYSVFCSVLQCLAVSCSILQCLAATIHTYEMHCNILRHTATHSDTSQHIGTIAAAVHTATHCLCNISLQHTVSATSQQNLQRSATHCNTLRYIAIHCNKHCNTHCNTQLQLRQLRVKQDTVSL